MPPPVYITTWHFRADDNNVICDGTKGRANKK
jgi:hypothetical protein